MLHVPQRQSDPVLADHSDYLIKSRESRSLGHEVHQMWLEVELTGDLGCGATINVEVDFIQTYKGSPPSWDDPGSADEYEIVAVRPFETRTNPNGFRGTERHYLPAANWLIELLTACVDPSELRA